MDVAEASAPSIELIDDKSHGGIPSHRSPNIQTTINPESNIVVIHEPSTARNTDRNVRKEENFVSREYGGSARQEMSNLGAREYPVTVRKEVSNHVGRELPMTVHKEESSNLVGSVLKD